MQDMHASKQEVHNQQKLGAACGLHQLVPVPRPQRVVPHTSQQRQHRRKGSGCCLYRIQHGQAPQAVHCVQLLGSVCRRGLEAHEVCVCPQAR
jgi:hypothetical protein